MNERPRPWQWGPGNQVNTPRTVDTVLLSYTEGSHPGLKLAMQFRPNDFLRTHISDHHRESLEKTPPRCDIKSDSKASASNLPGKRAFYFERTHASQTSQ